MPNIDDIQPQRSTEARNIPDTTPEPQPELASEPPQDTAPELEAEQTDPTTAAPETTPSEPVAEDPQTDEAVEDIQKKEGDDVLAAQDITTEKNVVMHESKWQRFKDTWAAWWDDPRKRWGSIGAVIALLAVLFGVPFTRYNLLGLVCKAPVTVQVVDSKSGAPVSGATVKLDGKSAETQGDGRATLRVKTGSSALTVSKKYYSTSTQGKLVALSSNNFKASLTAQGMQVKVKVVDKVSGKPVANAEITAGGAKTKTDKDGLATLVVASGTGTQAASVALDGYNSAKVTVSAGGDISKNTFSIVPAGKLYFLSNLSGTIDVVKTNLDGTDRQTVLKGTGSEDRQTTSLLAARDWKYLALLSKRSGSSPSVYLIDTTNGDKLTTIDQGDANFSLVGWSGDQFIYTVTRNTVQDWQANKQALKSYDATSGQNLLLDQTQGAGTDANNFATQSIGSPYLIGNQVVYAKNWNGSYVNQSQIAGKQAELDTIGADGSGHRTIKSFAPTGPTSYIAVSTEIYEPSALYVWFQDGNNNQFYDYEDGKLTSDSAMTPDKFYGTPYPTYLLSPSGNQTFWADQRDGKNTLFVGDQDAKNQKQIASLSDYNTYGWYSDNYLLVSKNSSELYIMGADGGTPLKITDYYKPAINYQGYGGGYGGL